LVLGGEWSLVGTEGDGGGSSVGTEGDGGGSSVDTEGDGGGSPAVDTEYDEGLSVDTQ
jgi:hypothetical protein